MYERLESPKARASRLKRAERVLAREPLETRTERRGSKKFTVTVLPNGRGDGSGSTRSAWRQPQSVSDFIMGDAIFDDERAQRVRGPERQDRKVAVAAAVAEAETARSTKRSTRRKAAS